MHEHSGGIIKSGRLVDSCTQAFIIMKPFMQLSIELNISCSLERAVRGHLRWSRFADTAFHTLFSDSLTSYQHIVFDIVLVQPCSRSLILSQCTSVILMLYRCNRRAVSRCELSVTIRATSKPTAEEHLSSGRYCTVTGSSQFSWSMNAVAELGWWL